MPYARHETFYIRDGWLRKGLRLVEERGYEFFRDEEAPEVLGVGKNMVNSIRFWLRATGLLEQVEGREYALSSFAREIIRYDPYFEDGGTWWLIHYHLVTDPNEATTWYWFFNVFNRRDFDEDTFLYWLKNYTVVEGTPVADGSLKKDFQCFVNTYLYEYRMATASSPEDNLHCPLRELKILRQTGPRSYRVGLADRNSLPPLIVYYCMAHRSELAGDGGRTTVTRLLNDLCNVGRVFSLTYEELMFYLTELQRLGFIRLSLTAGLDAVELIHSDLSKVLENYYSSELGEDGLWSLG
ncbi:MAG: DUF4007 family protein [Limnochordia bacterium]|jgi:hypothetical protein|nr:DUF4007 family protein [Bacillota bacterium]